MRPRWPGNYLKSVYLFHSCLVSHSIIDLLLKTSFWANFYSSYNIILSYSVKHSIQRNMHEKKRWETCVDQNIKGNKSETIVAYISEKSNFLDLEPSTMIQALCHFSPLSEVFVDVWLFLDTSIGEFENGIRIIMEYGIQQSHKKWALWHDLGSIIMILTCNFCSSSPQGLFRYSGCFSLSVSRACMCLVTCKSAKKWYVMRMCISWLCPSKALTSKTHHSFKSNHFKLFSCQNSTLSLSFGWLFDCMVDCISYLFGIVQSSISLDSVSVCSSRSTSIWLIMSEFPRQQLEAVSSLWRAQWPANLNLPARIVSLTLERLPYGSRFFICCWQCTFRVVRSILV